MPRNLNQIHEEKLSPSEKASDKLSEFIGSWLFLSILGSFMLFWVALNVIAYSKSWDPYPFILLNLLLSVTAAIEAPIILMSQNRMEKKDRLRAELDYETDVTAESEIQDIKKQLEEIKALLRK